MLDAPVSVLTAVSNEFLTAARATGMEKKDFACLFDLLVKMSGI